jgi:glycosyltransferase involved in cell wall biosynthesis
MAIEDNIPRTALVACSRLVDFAGAEIASLEIAEALRDLGVEVILASLEIGPKIESEIKALNIEYIDLSTSNISKTEYDLIWISHYIIAYHLLIRDGVRAKTGIYSSLSHFEPLEAPPLSGLCFSKYLVNSQENFLQFKNRYRDFMDRVDIFPNTAPAYFFQAYREAVDNKIKSVAIISNHPPSEIMELIELLQARGVLVDLIGSGGKQLRVTPEILSSYNVIVTIGKTIQYCLAAGTPVFCYDHFGGPGWITLKSFDAAFAKNFSGRCTPFKQSAAKILEEIFAGYSSALSQRELLRDLARTHFDLTKNLLKVISTANKLSLSIAVSETDKQILSHESAVFLKQRQIIENYQQAVSSRDNQIIELKQITNTRDSQITELKQIVDARDSQITEFKQIVDARDRALSLSRNELAMVLNSTSWKLTTPLRHIVTNVRLLRVRLRALLVRSAIIFRSEGLSSLIHRSVNFIKRVWHRRKAAKRLTRFVASANNPSLKQAPPLVSFIIPIYDRVDLLRTAIKSILEQTLQVFELILVTDGSPSTTMAVVKEFCSDPRVKIFNYPISSGNAVRGRNKGILEARGKYIAFLDSDDIASPDRLEVCLPILESNKADVVYGAWRALLDGSRHVEGIANGQVVHSPDCDLAMLEKFCVPCQSTVMVRRDMLLRTGFLKSRMEYREDHELWLRLAYHGARFKAIPHVLCDLRLHGGNNELNFKHNDNQWCDRAQVEYTKTGPRPKKIAFILPGVGISGGIAVVLKHAALLMEAEHDVYVINIGPEGDAGWFTGNPVPIVHISDQRHYLFENIDMLFATGWSTAEWLNRFSAERKLYFVQSDERRFFEDEVLKEKIRQTYLMQCEYLTEALWIKRMLWNEFGHEATYIPNGLDTTLFFPDTPLTPKTPGKVRVLLEGPINIPFKGMTDSYQAVEGLNCEIWIVSSAGKPPAHWKYDRFYPGVSFGEMKSIYSSCDIFLKMSRVEGFFGPPMEAMACGCSVVVGKVTGYDEYITDKENALVVEQGDILGARHAVQQLIDEPMLRQKLIRGGMETVLHWSWDTSKEAMLKLVGNTQ